MAKKVLNGNEYGKGFDKNPQNINRTGRPKGSKNRTTIVKYWLETKKLIKNPINGKDEILPIEDQITIALIGKALKGDVNAFKELMDSGYGKITDKTELTGAGGKDLIPKKIEFVNFDNE